MRYLHKYRNEAYHHSRVRRETIATAATLLLDINCELLTSLVSGAIGYGSHEDYSWLQERFEVEPHQLLGNDALLNKILEVIKDGVLPTPDAVKEVLAEHLESRFDELSDALDFVVESTRIEDNEEALRVAHFDVASTGLTIASLLKAMAEFESPYTLRSIDELRARIPEIRTAADRLEGFQRFSEIEGLLEPIEEPVLNQAAEVDRMIQMEIDIARGK